MPNLAARGAARRASRADSRVACGEEDRVRRGTGCSGARVTERQRALRVPPGWRDRFALVDSTDRVVHTVALRHLADDLDLVADRFLELGQGLVRRRCGDDDHET